MSRNDELLLRPVTIATFAFCILLLLAGTTSMAIAADATNYLYTTGGDSSLRIFAADSGTLVKTVPGSGTCAAIASGNKGRCIYVADGDSLEAIDTSDDEAFASVSYAGAAAHISCMVTGSDNTLYVADSYLKCINVYSPDLTLISSIPANPGSSDADAEGYLPVYLAISPDGSRLYAGSAYGRPSDATAISSDDYSLLIFDALTGERLKVIGLHAADSSGNAAQEKYLVASMKISPAGDYLWMGVYQSDAGGKPVDGTSQLLAIKLPVTDSFESMAMFVPPVPYDLVMAPDGGMVYALASYSGEGGMISYDARGFQIARLYTMGNVNMRHGAISSDGSKLYISNDRGYSVVDLGSGSVTDVPAPGSVSRLVMVSKEAAPTPVPATPTPEPVMPSPTIAPVSPTPVTSVATPAPAASTPAPGLSSATPAPVPLPSQGQSSPFGCLGMPVIGIGAIVTLGPVLRAVRKMRP